MPIFWKNTMSIGDHDIDHDHKYLFSIVNCVELSIKLGDIKLIEAFIEQLIEYSIEHFAHEEKFQLKINYPYYFENKSEHQEIIQQLSQLKDKLLSTHKKNSPAQAVLDKDIEQQPDVEKAETTNPETGPEQQVEEATSLKDSQEPSHQEIPLENKTQSEKDAIADETIALMRHWILDHVLTTDRKMKPFI